MKYDVFCNVIDNYGDAGVCLRLCRELVKQDNEVKLFCNHLPTLQKILNKSDLNLKGFAIKAWQDALKEDYKAAPCIIAAFSCHLEPKLLSQIEKQSLMIINLEYLSAENFVEEFHAMPSPLYKIPCYFFFPGFTSQTGGLNYEQSFKEKILQSSFNEDQKCLNLTLFSYKNKNILKLIEELQSFNKPCCLDVFEGLALDNLNDLLNLKLSTGQSVKLENLTIHALAMTSQDEYDTLLLKHEINLVRGEDSICRAMLCGKPFLWQIYPQDENAHLIKLNSFLDKMQELAQEEEIEAFKDYRKIMLFYNGEDQAISKLEILNTLFSLKDLFKRFSIHLLNLGSLAQNLDCFCKEKLKAQIQANS